MNAKPAQDLADFLEKHHGIVWKIANSFCEAPGECDDLFQEICIGLWAAYDSMPSDVKPSTYVYRVALNRAISWQRKERTYLKHVRFYFSQSTPREPEPDSLEQSEQLRTLYKAIRSLPESDRSLVLMFLDDIGYAEMASILGVSEPTVRKRVSRVKQKLAALIQTEGEQS